MSPPLCLLFYLIFFLFSFFFVGKKEFAVLFRKSTSPLVFHERRGKEREREREREAKLRAGKQEYEYLAGYRVEGKL